MVEFGEELIIDTFRIPWLIWIQLLVFFLLIFLVYSFSVFGSDSDLCSSDISSCPSSSSSSRKQLPVLHLHQAGDNQSIKEAIAAVRISSDNTGIRDRRMLKKEGSSSSSLREIEDGGANKTPNNNNVHPCNIVRLAKIAFLKCLGLDSSSSSSSSSSNQRR